MNKYNDNIAFNNFIKSERQNMIVVEINKSNGIIKREYLSDKFGVTERTISRDIKEILRKNNSIIIICGRNGGYKNLKGNDGN